MKTIHLKSPCCQETIHRFGGKRRVCSKCRKTWTIRPKKRGRKSIRRFKEPAMEIIRQGITLTVWASRHHLSLANASQQVQRSLLKLIKKPATKVVPEGPYVLLADALWFTFTKQDWAIFLLALKPLSEQKAYFLDPVLLPKGESHDNWNFALATIPDQLKNQIKALVSDGFRASKTIASENKWIHQRCHFHLIAYLQVRRGKRKIQLTGSSTREAIYQTVLKLLREPDSEIDRISTELRSLAKQPDCPRSLQMTAAEVLRSLPEFRAYLDHRHLHLPATTGSVETMCKIIRKRSGTVRTVKTLKLWATALVRLKSPLTCNGKELSTDLN